MCVAECAHTVSLHPRGEGTLCSKHGGGPGAARRVDIPGQELRTAGVTGTSTP